MCKLILFIVSVLQSNENAQIMRSSHNTYASTCEFGAYLVVTLRTNAFFRAIDVESGNRRVVGGLFGKVGDGDELALARDTVSTTCWR